MTATADIFAQVVKSAMRIDRLSHPGPPQTTGPTAIAAAVLAVHDRLPGGSGVSETGVRAPKMEPCTDPSCPDDGYGHSHPTPPDPTGDAAMRPSRSDADLRLLEQSVDRFVVSVGELVARSRSRGVPATWDEAVMDAGILDEWDAITSLEAAWGAKAVRRWVTNAGDALEDMERLWRAQLPRQASKWQRYKTAGYKADEVCEFHAALTPPMYVPKREGGKRQECRHCGDLRRLAGTTDGLVEVLQLHEHGGQVEYRNALSRWLQENGVRACG